MRGQNVIVQEQLLHVPLDDFLQKDHIFCQISVLIDGIRQKDHSRKDGGNLHHGKFQLIISLFLSQKCGNIQ